MIRIIRHPGHQSHHPRGAVLAIGNFDGLHKGHALLIERAQDLATRRGTSLSQMIRELLEEATAASSRKALADELERLWSASTGCSTGRRWTREELCDRVELL